MLPYFQTTTLAIGPLNIHLWGAMVALAVGAVLFALHVRTRHRQDVLFDRISDMALWTILASFAGARAAHVLFYEPAYYFSHPAQILQVWQGGLSSLGGITAGVLVALWYARRQNLNILAYGDVIFRSLPIAWAVGRFGCYLTHMHPGVLSRAPFAVAYPDGARLDLGLLESLVWIAMAIAFTIIKPPQRAGFYIALLPLLYAPARFALDFLRAQDTLMPDVRYAGLTPAQYGMVVMWIIGWWVVVKYKVFQKK